MDILFDTNIVLDALLDRKPWSLYAKTLWEANLDGTLAAYITATSLTDIFYISRRITDRAKAWQIIEICLDQLHVISVDIYELQLAKTLSGNDFEDNLQIACAMSAKLDAIVTRDPSGFSAGAVPVFTSQQMCLKVFGPTE